MRYLSLLTSKTVSFLCFLIGILSFGMLSQLEISQRTYMSENALLVGLIKQQFTNITAINQFYREYSTITKNSDNAKVVQWLKDTMAGIGLDVGIQNFTFQYDKLLDKQKFNGQNVYGILRSPGAARMQAILITAPLRYGPEGSEDSKPLLGSIACMLALAQHSRYKLYWAMDVIFLFTDMEYVGMKAWLNGYNGLKHPNDYIVSNDLFPRSGSILAGFNVEIVSQNIPYLEFKLESLNGQLPNLDLFNAAVRLSADLEIPVRIHGVPTATSDSFHSRKRTFRSFFSMMWAQSSGSPNGLHGLLADFQIPSLTIYSPLSSRTDSKSNLYDITKLMESTLRSLNSLQERMHQSFFFYLLPSTLKYVSIGMYMPSFGVMCGLALLLPVVGSLVYFSNKIKESFKEVSEDNIDGVNSNINTELFDWSILGKFVTFSFGLGFITNCAMDYFLSVSHRFNTNPETSLLFGAVSITVSILIFCKITVTNPNLNLIFLLQTVSRLGLGLFLGTLSVLNISMAFFLGLLIVPASIFVFPYKSRFLRIFTLLYLICISPLSLIYVASLIHCKYIIELRLAWSNPELYRTALTYTRHSIIQGWVEKDLLGSWTVDILTLGYLPFWIMNWCIANIRAF